MKAFSSTRTLFLLLSVAIALTSARPAEETAAAVVPEAPPAAVVEPASPTTSDDPNAATTAVKQNPIVDSINQGISNVGAFFNNLPGSIGNVFSGAPLDGAAAAPAPNPLQGLAENVGSFINTAFSNLGFTQAPTKGTADATTTASAEPAAAEPAPAVVAEVPTSTSAAP